MTAARVGDKMGVELEPVRGSVILQVMERVEQLSELVLAGGDTSNGLASNGEIDKSESSSLEVKVGVGEARLAISVASGKKY